MSEPSRALWVNEASAVTDPGQRRILADFARARGVDRLYLHGYPALRDDLPALASGLDALQAFHPEVLLGDPAWIVDPDARRWLHAHLVPPLRSLGVPLHLDLEPHQLPEWADPARRAGLVAATFEVVDELREVVPVHADWPAWWAGMGWLGEAIARTDATTVMAYAPTLEATLALALPALDCGRVTVGIELDPRQPVALQAPIEPLEAALKDHPSYAGLAIHAYELWATAPGSA